MLDLEASSSKPPDCSELVDCKHLFSISPFRSVGQPAVAVNLTQNTIHCILTQCLVCPFWATVETRAAAIDYLFLLLLSILLIIP